MISVVYYTVIYMFLAGIVLFTFSTLHSIYELYNWYISQRCVQMAKDVLRTNRTRLIIFIPLFLTSIVGVILLVLHSIFIGL